MSIKLSDTIEPAFAGAIARASDIRGANQSVATLTERDEILEELRVPGMVCYVSESQKYYSLSNDLTTWSEFSGGLASPIELYSWTCGENIQEHQLVFVVDGVLIVADCTNLSGASLTIGMALQTGTTGQTIEIVTRGLVINPLWDWSTDELFLGEQGQFSTVRPASPSVFWKVAQVTSTSSLFFNPSFPIIR